MRRACLIFVLALPIATLAAARSGSAEMNLYDWMGPAPVVVHGQVLRESGKIVDFEILTVIRGGLEPGVRIGIRLRTANLDRGPTLGVLKLVEEQTYLLLLRDAEPRKGSDLREYDLVRGVRGARELPLEGGGVMLEAARTLALIQDQKDESLTWNRMRGLLEETNPILISTALDHHVKFRRGDLALLPVIRPLLDHPQPELRAGSARLIGTILSRHGGEGPPDGPGLRGELAGRARRDPDSTVRIAATEALNELWSDATEEVLEQVAKGDPDQLVRYTAQRLLYERRSSEADGADGS